jgi:hypothetical protein
VEDEKIEEDEEDDQEIIPYTSSWSEASKETSYSRYIEED